MKKILGCIILGVLTFYAISAIDYLPYESRLVDLQDMLNLPGVMVFGMLWPEGIHSEGGGNWVIIPSMVNVLSYSVFWFVVVAAVRRLKKK